MKISTSLFNLITISEEDLYNYPLDFYTKFNNPGESSSKLCNKITLNFGFKDIKFEKKYMVLYFFILELLSNQKCVITKSKKNLIVFKIKKGSVTGCKVNLQKESLDDFLEALLIGLPRTEVFKGLSFKKSSDKYHAFSTKIKNLFIFYTIESEILNYIKFIDITFNFNTLHDIEKCFFFTYNKIPLKIFEM